MFLTQGLSVQNETKYSILTLDILKDIFEQWNQKLILSVSERTRIDCDFESGFKNESGRMPWKKNVTLDIQKNLQN